MYSTAKYMFINLSSGVVLRALLLDRGVPRRRLLRPPAVVHQHRLGLRPTKLDLPASGRRAEVDFIFRGQRHLVLFLFLNPPFFPIIPFVSTTL
jgi:hypothetical protein